MKNQMKKLQELLPHPARPLRCGNLEIWHELQEKIDFQFPEDFLEYGKLYGTGKILISGYGLKIANPLDPKYSHWVKDTGQDVINIVGDPPELRDYTFYPEPRGLVPFAEEMSGELFFLQRFRTAVKVVSMPLGEPGRATVYPCSFTEFLVKLITQKLDPPYFPVQHLDDFEITFEKLDWL
tara:strand:- start:4746 stop:5288 length:543 start_codon:yes stop_codon:yes gene_type:complete